MSTRALLQALRQAGFHAGQPQRLPRLPPATGPQIVVGLASTVDADCDRIRLSPYAFGVLPASVPLRHEHRPTDVGTVQALEYTADGSLRVRARVTDPAAQRCGGFSVGVRVADWVMHKDGAEVLRAELLEISCTDAPHDARALVQHRRTDELPEQSPHAEFFALMIRRVSLVQQMLRRIPLKLEATNG